MKRILIIVMSMMISTCGFTQSISVSTLMIAQPQPKFDLHLTNSDVFSKSNRMSNNNSDVRVGPIMMLGGAGFILASVLTPPVMVGGSTTDEKPFLQQGGKSMAMISGCMILGMGIVISLSGN